MSYPTTPNPYGQTVVPQPGNPSETEAWALMEAGRRMAAASREGTKEAIRDAVRLNWKLWTIFQTELITQGEQGPLDDIRVNLLTLCQFVDKHTVQVLADPVPEKLQPLIEINRNISAGMNESIRAQAVSAAADSQAAADGAAPTLASTSA